MPQVDAGFAAGAGPKGDAAGAAPYVNPGNGRLCDAGVDSGNCGYAVLLHILPLIAILTGVLLILVAPIVMWAVRKEDHPFEDDHGREVMNFGISFVLIHVLLAITIIGMLLWPVIWIVAIVNLIRGAVAAGHGEYFRYPMTWRFIQ